MGRARRSGQKAHPVHDFLFTYYSLTPGQLERWHPGAGVVLLGQEAVEQRGGWKHHRIIEDADGLGTPGVTADLEAFSADRASMVDFAGAILLGTADRPGNFSCFGLHEWAMAYRSEIHGVRHAYLPLRLGNEGTNTVVEEHQIKCTHFDAFRFYSPEAVPLNQQGENVYFGLAGSNGADREEVIPFFQPDRERFLEYDLTKAVYNLSVTKKPQVGVLSSLPK